MTRLVELRGSTARFHQSHRMLKKLQLTGISINQKRFMAATDIDSFTQAVFAGLPRRAMRPKKLFRRHLRLRSKKSF